MEQKMKVVIQARIPEEGIRTVTVRNRTMPQNQPCQRLHSFLRAIHVDPS
jgi:hypothetical protein